MYDITCGGPGYGLYAAFCPGRRGSSALNPLLGLPAVALMYCARS